MIDRGPLPAWNVADGMKVGISLGPRVLLGYARTKFDM
jgi:hypothetical protein